MSARYWELSVPTAPPVAEGLTNFVWESGALGVVEEERPGEAPRLRAFFADAADTGALVPRVDGYLDALRALGFTVPGSATLLPVADTDWAVAWREHFRPLPVGRRLLITPPWERPRGTHDEGRTVIVLEPGRAFGTGQHATTVGCLVLLERILDASPVARVTDLGTGSGILAIAAARLGAGAVLAVDSDPDAVGVAAENAALNGVAERVRCVVADAADPAVGFEPAPLVVANLLTSAHLGLAPRYAGWVAPGGALVLGGILSAEAGRVRDAMCCHEFVARDALTLDGWISLELARPTGSDAALHAGT
ncbi:MAG: 50S ribosomal protein L11 methyltransferase [Candidatus Rokuibacteriota bacterium]